MNILKGSLIYKFCILFAHMYKKSTLAKCIGKIAQVCKNSVFYKVCRSYFNKRCFFEYSLIYRFMAVVAKHINIFMRALGVWLNKLFRGSIFVRAVRNFTEYGFGVIAVAIALFGVVIGAVLSLVFGISGIAVNIVIVMAVCALIAAAGIVLHNYIWGLYILSGYAVVDYILRTFVSAFAGLWDEAFFLGLVCLCLWKWAVHNRDCKGIVFSPMDIPIFGFIATMVFVYLVNSPDPVIALEGLRVIIQYVLWYYVAVRLIKNKRKAVSVSKIFVLIVGVMALHGILQFIVGVEMPAGWVDQNEAGVRTRVYSILTSPNIFGSLLTLGAPVALGIAFGERRRSKQLFYFGIACAMIMSLLFTFSRGAWIGFAVAFAVYVLIKDKRLLIPGIVAAVIVVVAVPSVGNRITYMLSPEYIESSLRGGRLVRWITGARILSFFPTFGVGLGHFGGAVAMNHGLSTLLDGEYTETFYMDNNYLKIAVETGIVGITAMLALMYCVIINSLRTVSMQKEKRMKELTTGITAGLTGVIVHNCVENVFEVPLMCTVFWLFVGVIMSIWYNEHKRRQRTHKKLRGTVVLNVPEK